MRLPRSTGARVAGAALAMLLVAEGAVWLLAPREEIPDPIPVDANDYLPAEQIARAEDYRSGQRWLMIGGLVIEAGVLAAVALGRPRPVRRLLDAFGRRPIAGAAAAGALVALTTALVTLPTRVAAHERAVDVGLSTQSLGSWGWDAARSAGITAVLTGGGTALLIAMVRRYPRGWWAPGAVAVTGFAVLFTWIAPVVLAPVFNDFETLPQESRAREDVLRLGREAGVEIGEVYSIDASRRVTSLNAYVDGIGPTKRVVLYDNLLDDAERPELNSVVAHELGHVAHDDILRGLVFVAIVAPLGLLFVREFGCAISRRGGADPASPAAVPAYLLALGLATFAINVPGNQLSREVEESADWFALELTENPDALVELQRRLAESNLADPDPPALLTTLFGTHPPTVDRIGTALAYERERTD